MRLTVCVTTFNRWEQCHNAVSSIFAQNSNDFELIVVDDCSVKPIPKHFFDELRARGARYLRHDANRGLAAARNSAIQLAKGEFFAFCDDDDQWPPDFVDRILYAFDSNSCDFGIVLALDVKRKRQCKSLFDSATNLTALMRAGFTPPVASQAYKTELLREIGGYRTEVSSGVDHDLWVSLARTDPKVAVSWGEPAKVSASPFRDRMTTVELRRRAGIEKSLSIWRSDLCDVFGIDFFDYFVKSYQRYLDYNFFVKSMQRGELLDAATRVIKNPYLLTRLLIRKIRKIFRTVDCSTFPKYNIK